MVVPEEREGRTEAAMLLSRDASKASDAVNTRKAGGQSADSNEPRKVKNLMNPRLEINVLRG